MRGNLNGLGEHPFKATKNQPKQQTTYGELDQLKASLGKLNQPKGVFVLLKLRCLGPGATGVFGVTPARRPMQAAVPDAEYSHPYIFHTLFLLFPYGHLDVHFPTSPAFSQPTTIPRYVSMPSSPGCATPPGHSTAGPLANLNTSTGYEPKYDIDNDTEITPIIFSDTDDHEPNLSMDLISEGE